ncbi:putative Nucleoporin [Glarea lozoyensis 74030]|uniref:Putative Nucleoporin n=1 Tax=Glarea lozoyensis (strain ATCC 74030 / MF5533) TaxID=1104152 RepID=H0EPG8_GLAL7|nr:putative Nucleoporin [Glarea lozoyensis 74030]
MSGFGGFGGFGANNNNNTTPAFGGGFGANNTANTGSGLFGGNNTSGFGGAGGGFGSSTGAFGAPKSGGFGATNTSTSGSIFGGGNTTTTSGGFGGGFGQTSAPATGFGAPAASTGGLFGQPKTTGFGGTSTFGNNNATPAFGGASTGAFGAPASTALGGATGECQGTGSVPFSPFIEKEPNSTNNQQNAFQSISFQQPYQKWSPEELRLADYQQGRKTANASGQAGAFGASTGFGGSFGASNTASGFGANNNNTNTGGGLFGNNASSTTNSPFGASQPAASGFGASTGGGIFGAAKPATTGLFGAQPAQQSTGLFGQQNNTSSGFGTGASTTPFGATNTAGGGLFGNNSNSAAKTPFSFGTSQPATGGTGFGTATSGGFGAAAGTSGFGASNTGTSLFGGQQQQPAATSTTFGGFGGAAAAQPATSTSLFGAQKPATGMFGAPAATNTGTGLFGNTSTANSNPFGGTNNTNQGTSNLFGAQKPATTGLFGNTNTQTNTGGSSLFGGFGGQNQNNQQQQQTGNSLFGGLGNNNNQQQQQKPSLFGQSQPANNSLFGGNNNQQQGSSLFGNTQQNQQPSNSLFGGNNSLLGNSAQGQQGGQSLTASINDSAAYGGTSLFSSLQSTQINNPGPIATPLSSAVKQKKNAALPMYKLNSASTSRFSTPQKRGFGFSYSNYGTPGSASSTSSTPGTFSSNTFSRTLKASASTSSLRRSFNTEDSILAPGAFSASPSTRHYGSTGSVKKLNINRNLRNDLFSPPNPQQAPAAPSQGGILKKRVSFEAHTATNGVSTSSPLKNITNGSSPTSEEMGLLRPSAKANGKQPSNQSPPEMEQVQNNELAVVHEEEAANPTPRALPEKISQEDQEVGEYWMKPSLAEIKNMNRTQRQKVSNLIVGREGCGQVTFGSPVDLTLVNVDDIIAKIVKFDIRSCTVYQDDATKPPMGKGLNVPSIISLQNSWPRKKDMKTPSGEKNGHRFQKHIERLRRVKDTKFLNYDKDTGVWTFSVEHFTTYAAPDEDDETEMEEVSEFGQSTLSAPPDTPTPSSRDVDQSFASVSQISMVSQTESDPEDTFDFKTSKRKKVVLPGAFDEQAAYYEDDEEMEETQEDETYEESFLDNRSVGSQSENGVDEPMDQADDFQDDESVSIADQEMAGSYPQAGNTAELDEEDSQDGYDAIEEDSGTQNALVRARLRASQKAATPMKTRFSAGNDWTATLRKTVSPKKQDRALLKTLIHFDDDSLPDFEPTPTAKRVVADGRGFATSIDLMNSLFGQTKSPAKPAKTPAKGKGFEWPYAKRSKTFDNDMSNMTDIDRAYHSSMRPSWGPDGTLVYSGHADVKSSRRGREKNGLMVIQKGAIVSEGRDRSAALLEKHKTISNVTIVNGIPYAKLPENTSFLRFREDGQTRDPAATHEQLVWSLASILWDPVEVPETLRNVENIEARLRRDRFSTFWQDLVARASSQHVALAKSEEEKAIAALAGHNITDACKHLINGKNFHLATLVATIGAKASVKKDIRKQLQDWQKDNMLSDFSEAIRALYELLAGNVAVCAGSKGVKGEDRVESFGISKRFGLDWKQAFGLRLWYGALPSEPIEATVELFTDDIVNGKESARPQAWYVEERIPTLWEDEERDNREDLLYGLLKLHTFSNAEIQAVLCPPNSQLSPVDFRLSWQLAQALTNAGVVSSVDEARENELTHTLDELTLSFAAQLTNEGSWLDAIFVLLHLSAADPRAKSIQDILAQFAGGIGAENSQTFNVLSQSFKIPIPWIWEAKALYMRSVERNPTKEVECLIKASSFNEAHHTFAREVAPKTIVELDYDVLRTLLDSFKGQEDTISEWHLGGQIYSDFLTLLDSQKKYGHKVDLQALDRLLSGLPAVVEKSRKPSFMETVAVETISGTVAKQVVALGKMGEVCIRSCVL